MAFTFGAAPAASSPAPMFGAAGQTSTTAQKPLFGGFSTPTTQQQSQAQGQPQQSGSLFGSQPAQPANPAPLTFGAPAPAAGSGATGQQSGSGLFGQASQQPQQQQTGSLFGSTQAKPATTGLFGSTAPTQPQQSGSLFGQPSGAQQQQQPNSTGSTGLFGSMQQSQPQAQSNLFGSTTQPQTSMFGSSTQPQGQSTFGFGAPAQSQQFGQPQNQLNSSMFASTSGAQNVLGASMAPSQRIELDIGDRMMAVQRAWDTSSPECRFKYFFYNVVEPSQVQQYGRPAGANDDGKWTRALRDNPDPTCMVPVLATGWSDVKRRSEMQQQLASVHQQKIKEISQALDTLSRQSSLTTSIRLSALQTQLTQLQHRLVRLAAQSPSFIPALQSSALRPEEIETKRILDGVKADVDGKRPSGGGAGNSAGSKSGYSLVNVESRSRGLGMPGKGSGAKMLGQVNELWGQVEEIRRYRGRRQAGQADGWLNDERVLGEVAEVLATQQTALQKLNDLANTAIFDADVMRQGLGLVSAHERHHS